MGARFSLLVADMAGTTVRDDGLVLECFVRAAEAVGLAVTAEELNDRMGRSKHAVFDELARRQLGPGPKADALRDSGYALFRRVLEGAYEAGGVTPIDGAADVIAELRARGVKVALNTGFYRRVTEIIVGRLGWADAVDAIVCVDDVAEGRPAPYMIFESMQRCRVHAVGEVAVVGDTPSDMSAGHGSGARAVIGVTSGAHPGATLRRCPSTHVVGSVVEVPSLLVRLDRLARENR